MNLSPRASLTLFDRIWNRHTILDHPAGLSLLHVDLHLVHEGSFHGFAMLREKGLPVAQPEQTFGTADHYVPTTPAGGAESARMVELFARNTGDFAVRALLPGDAEQGIVHVVGPELGITLPGMVIVCGDSHTSTHGGLGAFAFGIGQTELAHVLATQTIWQRRPKTMRISVSGILGAGISAKDVALGIIGNIGTGGGTGYVIEYAGPAIKSLSIEQRLTLCNMTIEAGAKAGMVAPDDVTFNYIAGRRYAPAGAAWGRALGYWRTLKSDDEAVFDREVTFDASDLKPMVTWGTSPEDVLPIDSLVPDPDKLGDPSLREKMRAALGYMDLLPGTRLTSIPVDTVFIGSCTNARLEDLRAAAAQLAGGLVRVRTIVVPGSSRVRAAAEAEGLDRLFIQAGAEWRSSGCSMCVAMNGDSLAPGSRCASTTNRNFPGRQGKGVRTHLMSPAMAAAAAITGRLTDITKAGWRE